MNNKFKGAKFLNYKLFYYTFQIPEIYLLYNSDTVVKVFTSKNI